MYTQDSKLLVDPYLTSDSTLVAELESAAKWIAPYDLITNFCDLAEFSTACFDQTKAAQLFISNIIPSFATNPTFEFSWGIEIFDGLDLVFQDLNLKFSDSTAGLDIYGDLHLKDVVFEGDGDNINVYNNGNLYIKSTDLADKIVLNSSRTMNVKSGGTLTLKSGTKANPAWLEVKGTLNIDSGSTLSLEDYSTIRARSGGIINVNSVPDWGTCSEIGANATDSKVNFNGTVDMSDPCSCLAASDGGEVVIAANKTITVDNDAFLMASNSGKLTLNDGVKIVINEADSAGIHIDTGGILNLPSGADVEIEIKEGGWMHIEAPVNIESGRTLNITGTGTVKLDALFRIKSGGTLDIAPGITFDMGLDGYIHLS